MTHHHRTVLLALAVALCAAPAAAAARDADNDRGGAVVAPAQAQWMAESWAQIYSLPVSENPFAGNGNPCLTLAHKVIQEIGGPCTIEYGTTFTLFFGAAWSSAEDPCPQTRREQLALAVAADRENVLGMTVTIDGGRPVEIRTPRFELFSPQRTVLLPADNLLGVDGPRTVTLSAHGWEAAIRKLRVGGHRIVSDVLFADGEHFVLAHILNVTPRHNDGPEARSPASQRSSVRDRLRTAGPHPRPVAVTSTTKGCEPNAEVVDGEAVQIPGAARRDLLGLGAGAARRTPA